MFTLIREETPLTEVAGTRHQWAVRFSAWDSSNAPAPIFVMQQAPVTDVFADSLVGIATALQMTTVPVGSPGEGGQLYRAAEVTHLCRSEDAAEEFVTKMEVAVQHLVNDIRAADKLSTPEETLIIPDNA